MGSIVFLGTPADKSVFKGGDFSDSGKVDHPSLRYHYQKALSLEGFQ